MPTWTMYYFIGLIPTFTLLIKIYYLYRFRIASADSSFSDKSNIDNQNLVELEEGPFSFIYGRDSEVGTLFQLWMFFMASLSIILNL